MLLHSLSAENGWLVTYFAILSTHAGLVYGDTDTDRRAHNGSTQCRVYDDTDTDWRAHNGSTAVRVFVTKNVDS